VVDLDEGKPLGVEVNERVAEVEDDGAVTRHG
jgi:hypothetical protein